MNVSLFIKSAINQMKENKQREAQRSHEESIAVNRLLQVAERKHYLQDWQEERKNHLSSSLPMNNRVINRSQERAKDKFNLDSRSLQKRHEKERLQYLAKEPANNEEESIFFSKELPIISDRRNYEISSRMLGGEQLRAYHSNLTFYHSQRQASKHFVNSSLTFYRKRQEQAFSSQKNQKEQQFNSSLAQTTQFMRSKMNSSIIYFKPNKSQTIRELLNQMKVSRRSNNELILNSTHKDIEEHQRYDVPNQHEIKQIKRYAKSMKSREDEAIQIHRVRQEANVWKRKFKESWQRRKFEIEGKKTYLKRLIVRD